MTVSVAVSSAIDHLCNMLALTQWILDADAGEKRRPRGHHFSSAAHDAKRARQARFRARARNGAAIFRLELAENSIAEALIIAGRLTEDRAQHRAEIEHALESVLNEWSAFWLPQASVHCSSSSAHDWSQP